MSVQLLSQKRLSVFLLATVLLSSCNIQGVIPKTVAKELPKFESCEAIQKIIDTNQGISPYGGYYGDLPMMEKMSDTPSASAGRGATNQTASQPQSSSDYSRTNVQVEGVDEADTTKTDGKYIYTLSNNVLYIVQALPADQMKIVGKISYASTGNNYSNVQEFFINGDNVVLFGTRSIMIDQPVPMEKKIAPGMMPIRPGYYPSRSGSFIDVYNISDPKTPSLKRSIDVEGNYLTSRMIGKNVYTVINSYPRYTPVYYGDFGPRPIVKDTESETVNTNMNSEKASAASEADLLPLFRDTGVDKNASFAPIMRCGDIHYVPEPRTAQYLTLLSFAVDNYTQPADKNITFGAGENVYASDKNLYVARTDWNYQYSGRTWIQELLPMLPDTAPANIEKTAIYKFALNDGKTEYLGDGTVSGTILNQFSMDEYDGNFRIATTQQSYGFGGTQSNNLFVLDSDLKPLGSITGIAPGEKIYSARFLGKRAYLVTFKTVDPLFTFDLSDPKNPKTLGKLKIPGYSDYLHPYDENHLIGLGKEVNESIDADKVHSNSAVYYTAIQGIKLALFDVTDVEHPKEMYKEVIGDRGSDSPALQNHKAFLFDRAKNLLVLPVTVAEISDPVLRDKVRRGEKVDSVPEGNFVFQGAYVYNLTLQNGFDLKGKISHITDPEVYKKSGYYMGDTDHAINRSLYIDDHLYTISNATIMANNFLNNLIQEGSLALPTGQGSTNYNGWMME